MTPGSNIPPTWYRKNCDDCERLNRFLKQVKHTHGDYFCKPVPPFGTLDAELLIVGLAPGKHGANATGRPFTGDHAGILLYQTLHRFGFCSAPHSLHREDGLELYNCRITNAVKCLPPENKPVGDEVANCNRFLAAELAEPNLKLVLALGLLAHRAVLRAFGLVLSHYPFGHNVRYGLGNGVTMVDSYHCSRYNTQTRRLTEAMFCQVFEQIRSELKTGKSGAK